MHASELACLLPEVVRFIVHEAMQKARSLEATCACIREPEVGRTNLCAKRVGMLGGGERPDLLGHAGWPFGQSGLCWLNWAWTDLGLS